MQTGVANRNSLVPLFAAGPPTGFVAVHLPLSDGDTVVDVACGYEHTVAVTANACVSVWMLAVGGALQLA